MNLKRFKKINDWTKVWSGDWSFHSCSQFGKGWTQDIKIGGRVAWKMVVYVSRKNISDCWISLAGKDDLAKRVVAQIRNNRNAAKEIADCLKSNTDIFTAFFKENIDKKIDLEVYNRFTGIINNYYNPHMSVKYVVDYLAPEELKKYLPIFEDARVYAEPVFRDSEIFIRKIADQIAGETGVSKDLILCTSADEMVAYFKKGKLVEKPVLEERYAKSIQFFELGESEIFSGEKAVEAEKIVLPKTGDDQINGQTAFAGRASGRVRIVIEPSKYKGDFDNGDILVTGMTRPEFMPFMQKSGAIVTDAGGILSHAAITARELKKPCVIGTKIATRILKDGDMVEVDANKGIVKILK